jgi:hypothetical protein
MVEMEVDEANNGSSKKTSNLESSAELKLFGNKLGTTLRI